MVRCRTCGKELPPGQEQDVINPGPGTIYDPGPSAICGGDMDAFRPVCRECDRKRIKVWVMVMLGIPILLMVLWYVVQLLS